MATRYFCDLCDRQVRDSEEFSQLVLTWDVEHYSRDSDDGRGIRKSICDSCRNHLRKIIEKLGDEKYRGDHGIL